VQERFRELDADPAEVDRLLAMGAANATALADPVLARAAKAAGLLPRAGS
jgi:tryptophanyl-tRNA synthetase